MRFFGIACVFGILVAGLGWVTQNWSSPLLESSQQESRSSWASTLIELDEMPPIGPGVDAEPNARLESLQLTAISN